MTSLKHVLFFLFCICSVDCYLEYFLNIDCYLCSFI